MNAAVETPLITEHEAQQVARAPWATANPSCKKQRQNENVTEVVKTALAFVRRFR